MGNEKKGKIEARKELFIKKNYKIAHSSISSVKSSSSSSLSISTWFSANGLYNLPARRKNSSIRSRLNCWHLLLNMYLAKFPGI
jgi:hypothetical protein